MMLLFTLTGSSDITGLSMFTFAYMEIVAGFKFGFKVLRDLNLDLNLNLNLDLN